MQLLSSFIYRNIMRFSAICSESVIKTFKQTLFSLPIDGSRDALEGSKRLLEKIAKAPSFEELPEQYKSKVIIICYTTRSISSLLAVDVDEFGIRRRKPGSAAKYAKRAFRCKLCKWGYSNKYGDKAKEHAEDCPAVWIYEDWKPQTIEDLKFIKS